MLWLKENLERIQKLVDTGTVESLTYAALECRIAIEQVCYYRLRNMHDYISHDELKKWQPGAVVQKLIQDVDKHLCSTITLYMSKNPLPEHNQDMTKEEYDALEYLKLGTQIGFDPKRMEKLWNALGSFLHAKMPKNREDKISSFGNPEKLRRKVEKAIYELRRVAEGTMIQSGPSQVVSFKCDCGAENKRREAYLKAGDVISCINPNCSNSWNVVFKFDGVLFEPRTAPVICKGCGLKLEIPERNVIKLRLNQVMNCKCKCGETTRVRWALMHELPVREGGIDQD